MFVYKLRLDTESRFMQLEQFPTSLESHYFGTLLQLKDVSILETTKFLHILSLQLVVISCKQSSPALLPLILTSKSNFREVYSKNVRMYRWNRSLIFLVWNGWFRSWGSMCEFCFVRVFICVQAHCLVDITKNDFIRSESPTPYYVVLCLPSGVMSLIISHSSPTVGTIKGIAPDDKCITSFHMSTLSKKYWISREYV